MHESVSRSMARGSEEDSRMTESEILIAEARKIAESVAETLPLLARFIHRLTDKYAEAVKDALRLENTIHLMTKPFG
jgi:hypothetical protein